MEEVRTVCPRDCYDTCSLIAEREESGRVLAIRGDPQHPMTQGFTCPRGAKDQERLLRNRVEAPLLRRGDDLLRADWDSALDVVSERLSETLRLHGADSVLYLDYAGNTGLLTGAFPNRLWNAIGATQTDKALCSMSGHAALGLHYGASHGVDPLTLPSRNLVVFWGSNAAVSSPHMWSLARKGRRTNGTQIVVIDPRESRTARGADLWIQPWPGSDVALAYGLINYLSQSEYLDLEFVQEWTLGFEQLREEAAKWTPERVEKSTGVAWSDVERLGEAYGKLRPSATVIGIGLQKNDQGADQVRTVSFIPALLGLHRGFFYGNADSFSVDQQFISGRSLTERAPRIVEQVALADLVRSGDFKFIYVNCMNPALTLPHQHVLREGLSREDVFLVVQDTHWTKTAQYADVVLPAPTFLEKEDLVLPWSHHHVRYSNQVVPPITDSRTETWIMQEIARRLGLAEGWIYENAWAAVASALQGAFEEGTVESLKSGAELRLKRKPSSSYPTPSGKVEFHSSIAAERGLNPLPVQAPLPRQEDRCVLLTSATAKYTSTQFQEVYGAIPAVVVLNPRDAERWGIEEGDIVVVSNERGEVKKRATISDAVREGVVWSPRQSEGLDGQPQNCLMSSEPQELGGGPRFNSTTVTISKVSPDQTSERASATGRGTYGE
jgi:anaerobic selenocysteine-containing dehydrogenase